MDTNIDYATVASNVAKKLGQNLADAVFELEQWKALATSVTAERDSLRDQLENKPQAEEV